MMQGRFSLSDRNQSRSDLPGSANRVAGHIDRAGVENQSAFASACGEETDYMDTKKQKSPP